MASEPLITTERVDDIPVLLTQMSGMGIKELLDKHFQTHGNWQGQSLGNITVIWLTYILSQADHRLNHVQGWLGKRLETLKTFAGEDLRELDLTDDRLEAVLRYLSDDTQWQNFEEELGGSIIRAYDLKSEQIRLDSTTASSYCGVNSEGLFQWGYSKDHRPDLAQVKIMLSSLDPLGMPIATDILSGNTADDSLYIPAIKRVSSTVKKSGLLYVGDCKMAAIATRGYIASINDYYLIPLSAKQITKEQLEEYIRPVWTGEQQLTTIDYNYADGRNQEIAVGFERKISQKMLWDEQLLSWDERQLVVRSNAITKTEEKSLMERLEKPLSLSNN